MTDSSDSERVPLDGSILPSAAIIRAAATLSNTEATELPPLYDTIDPDALNKIFAGRDGGQLIFEYAGTTVTVENETAVIVTPA